MATSTPNSNTTGLSDLQGKQCSVITCDGRNLVGVLSGFDHLQNVILSSTHERVFSEEEGVVQEPLGLYIIRGDNIAIIGELDEELDASLDLSTLRAKPIDPVIQTLTN
jgi:U6 snRNA-associated Sm-like protein LSm8